MATSSILHWVTRRSRSSNTGSAESTNDQGPHQSNVADEQSENTVVNGGQPSEAALPTSSEPASASTVSQSTSFDSATHGEMLVVGSPKVQPELISDSANQLFYNSLWEALENNNVCFVHRGILNTHGYTIKKAATAFFASSAWWSENVVFCTAQAMLCFLKSGFQTGKKH